MCCIANIGFYLRGNKRMRARFVRSMRLCFIELNVRRNILSDSYSTVNSTMQWDQLWFMCLSLNLCLIRVRRVWAVVIVLKHIRNNHSMSPYTLHLKNRKIKKKNPLQQRSNLLGIGSNDSGGNMLMKGRTQWECIDPIKSRF